MVRNFTVRRTGGSETTKWSQPGSREAALRGSKGGSEGLGGSPYFDSNPKKRIRNMVTYYIII